MTKLKIFIKSYFIFVLGFLLFWVLGVFLFYSLQDTILSLPFSEFIRIGFGFFCIFMMSHILIDFLDELMKNRKKDKKQHIISKPD